MARNRFRGNNIKSDNDLGFGTKNYTQYNRFLNKDGSVNILRKGQRVVDSLDFYHAFITMSWKKFLVIVSIGYLIVNTIFATIYHLVGYQHFGNLKHVSALHDFVELFFFSAQTLTTVGYGYVYPSSIYASFFAAIESMLGLLGFALATGILYGRFSRPKSEILYSENVLVAPYQDISALMFRVINPKQNELIEVEANVTLSMKNPHTNSRVFLALELERSKINFLALNWTIVHPINENSPLYGFTEEELMNSDAEFIVVIKSINDTYSQLVYSRTSYKNHEIVYGAKFKPMNTEPNNWGKLVLDIRQLNDFEKAEINIAKELAE